MSFLSLLPFWSKISDTLLDKNGRNFLLPGRCKGTKDLLSILTVRIKIHLCQQWCNTLQETNRSFWISCWRNLVALYLQKYGWRPAQLTMKVTSFWLLWRNCRKKLFQNVNELKEYPPTVIKIAEFRSWKHQLALSTNLSWRRRSFLRHSRVFSKHWRLESFVRACCSHERPNNWKFTHCPSYCSDADFHKFTPTRNPCTSASYYFVPYL